MGGKPTLGLMILAALATGCANGVSIDDQLAEQNAQGKADGIASEDGMRPVPTLHHRYALVFDSTIQTQSIDSEDPPETVLTTILADVVVSQEGDQAKLSIQPCQVVLPELEGRQPEVAPAVIRRINEVTVEARIRPNRLAATAPPESSAVDIKPDDESSAPEPDEQSAPAAIEGGDIDPPSEVESVDAIAEIESDPAAFVLVTERAGFVGGAKLSVPESETLPEDDDDPRLLDLDEDGKPGISIYIGRFRAYASFRLLFQMEGVVSESTIEGQSSFELDSQIVGDDIPFIDAADRARRAAENTVIVEEDHRFTMTPVYDDIPRCDFSL